MIFFYNFSSLIFGDSCRVDLRNFKTMDDYLKSMKSKRRNDLKKVIKQNSNLTIKEGTFKLNYIKYLYKFVKQKYKNKKKMYFQLFLQLIVLLTKGLKFFEYYDKDNIFLGWSSYFIHENVFYDFIAAPKKDKLFVSNILLNSIDFAIKNKLKSIDLGVSHQDLKKRKFNATTHEIKYFPLTINFSINIK